MPRPKQRTAELREHVLAAAVDLLVREGVSGFTARGVARAAETSTPAVYELFGDKSGLVREVFFAGFRLLRRRLGALVDTDDPRTDLIEAVGVCRSFVQDNPVLAEVMFSRPFSDFDPGPVEVEAGASVRRFVVDRVARCVDAGRIHGDPTDVAHVVLALALGLAGAETAQRLGTSPTAIDRRWSLGVNALLDGFSR
ncbi:TetR family transcriptional regulator [Actinocorallia herbida]|uniref:TetR family transcriptional regulator n=1 Tax=Actinocorallia herbida TaxID=58109 RepID=A0A3N1D356_9ACTN|nr:TetR/AcrR family transcriptional regulator [Actinocorallia herbida]ROO87967.1 TetR family transcriptional regulator [Actinocorallia herbida]